MRRAALLALALLLGVAPLARAATTRVQVAELSPQAESAIDKGLRYLAKAQNQDGSWGARYPAAITGLTMMAFMLKGYFPERGQHAKPLDRGLAWLLKRGKEGGGYLGGTNQGMYEHGLATLALAEVWGMTNKEEVRDILKRAVGVILRAQHPEGGWRYQPQPIDADISVTVMQIVALASAAEAGILVPAETIRKATAYVKKCQDPLKGGFGYTPGGGPNASLSSSAAGLLSLLMCGERDSTVIKKGINFLTRLPKEEFNQTKFYHYGHYYAVQAMYQAGENYYQDWYPKIHDALLRKQRDDGSWLGDGGEGDPAYGTSMSILILGVPYRFLPIYQR
ncbi:MAG: terpene cyclase/mutase family protein [Planctomycetes bacterium]|nr:terpene cyclase/mutase family protein [Planctomycetota bacterium]